MLSSLCTLHRHEGEQIILCGDGNLVRLLPKGHSELKPDLAVEGPACGLVAMGKPAIASSMGLKWDLGVVPPPPLRLHPRCVKGCDFRRSHPWPTTLSRVHKLDTSTSDELKCFLQDG